MHSNDFNVMLSVALKLSICDIDVKQKILSIYETKRDKISKHRGFTIFNRFIDFLRP